jgi:glycosyltransferase involved in cell wall biosynthesis
MKILNVSNTVDPISGGGEVERSIQMTKFLIQSGADCHVLTIDVGLTVERRKFIGINRITALPCLVRRFHIPKFCFNVINKVVAEADVVHLMGHWNILNVLVYFSVRKQKKPYIVCPAGSLLIFGRSRLLKLLYNFFIGNRIIRNATACVAITELEVKSFASYGINPDNVYVIPNGIDETLFYFKANKQFRKKFALGNRPFILFMGRLNLIKGPDLLLKAFCEIKKNFGDIDLVFAGNDNGMLLELKRIVKSEQVNKRVHFIGHLEPRDRSYAYHAATLLTIPSRHEAMSIVVLEALASGLPVLLTDQCGVGSIITGVEVVPATVDGIRNGLIEFLSDDRSSRVSSPKIKKYVINNFSWRVISQLYLKLYSSKL